ncbi:MAG: AbrB/MazE/SpoVT family DNA-binding domain-containing protein [Oscillospiraceae bacterium]|jgi:bifunctional DNA-binding transcriptional regulator/antitoxin component of YhaV-PrlF toxin-antitoxin module|nr:AbrB/MazE/SpoVT family DNA-binding domain-containing protein [Oscillospiraceae bacterium]
MHKITKILGKCGRITIPFEMRLALGLQDHDVVSFALDGDTVLVWRENVCDKCTVPSKDAEADRTVTLLQLLDDLSPAELRAALIHLSVKWAQMQEAGGRL